jgi:biopolymer transport protein ExbD
VVVTATADHRLTVNGKATTFEGLDAALREAIEKAGERNVVLQGDRAVVLEDAVRIMTVARAAGAEKLSIATEPDEKGKRP